MGASGAIRAKRWVASDWVTAANISGTGTADVASDNMFLVLPTIPIAEWRIHIRFTEQRTGGTGSVSTWARITNLIGDVLATAAIPTDRLTPYTYVINTPRTRNIYDAPRVLQSSYSASTDMIGIQIRSKGSAADTVLAVTDIMVRILYVPL